MDSPVSDADAGAGAGVGAGSEVEDEALLLKSQAEDLYGAKSFKSAHKHARRARRLKPDLAGIDAMVAALKTLRAPVADPYAALHLPPLSSSATARSQFESLSLLFSGDAFAGAAEAMDRISAAFDVLSDRPRKRALDLRLREAIASAAPLEEATFWTACAACRLLHEFDRRHLGQRLLCPRCLKPFLALEVPPSQSISSNTPSSNPGVGVRAPRSKSSSRPRIPINWPATNLRKRKTNASNPPSPKNPKRRIEKTLAEIQLELSKTLRKKNAEKKRKEKEMENSIVAVKEEIEDGDLSLMAVEDSDFYDFDKDRSERCFKKGQVWAIYDDDDGMPRHYGLIDEAVSSNPFRVKMSWLDVQSDGDEAIMLFEKSGHHVSCGRFKVGRKVDIDSVNMFSHLVDCERAAKEVYRVYPRKGSVWALYGEENLGSEGERRYDIVVFLTSYSEMHGLSMGYLEKVEGFKTIFKRREIGCHAVKWLEKDNVRLFSHQIPARKLTDMEGVDLPGECWELDPASLPADLLRLGQCR
ncbi:uncharacterized protein LOC120278701 [Dioscorea cayenensis subsp. rotundata]|uniref:Uncharacterized protein LOC120278701 n=1 Tax=Dioscorea cayennensis subsp. rotundata TaxID=55577 RepID=A0AB40CS60_DIOCR|nr:uncharacterized protein LOC120278701 [Dioscorea cayenensis subsp. rotundata]